MTIIRILVAFALLSLVACGADKILADDSAITQARYVSSDGPSITLYTVVNSKTGAGAHSALLVQGSESVLFDPAGSFKLRHMPERGDVLYGASPRWMSAYVDYHARDTHYVRSLTLAVPANVAEQILAEIKTNGAVNKAHCAHSISRILNQAPGFEHVQTTYFPLALEKAFAKNQNVVARTITQETADTSHGVVFLDKNDHAAIAAAGITP